jgi:hypothetical protein
VRLELAVAQRARIERKHSHWSQKGLRLESAQSDVEIKDVEVELEDLISEDALALSVA